MLDRERVGGADDLLHEAREIRRVRMRVAARETAADIDGVVGGGLLTGGIDPATVVSALGLPAVTWWARAAPPIMNHLVAAVNAVSGREGR